MGTIKIKREIEETMNFVPCLTCGSNDIIFHNQKYIISSRGTATCKKMWL